MLSRQLETEIESLVRQAMQTWGVPGLGLAIVKDGQTVMTRGFGIREMDKPETVDEHTLFAIGSNTKAFTAAAVGLLVQEGKLGWDDPVSRHLPGFRLYDEHTSALITVRDLLCHRSGLGTWAGDVLLFSRFPGEEIVRRLRHIPPSFGFRAGYGYTNLMFVTAGLVIERVSGMSWADFIEQRFFAPLGMRDSASGPARFGARTNIATPHEEFKGSLQTVPYSTEQSTGAAGSICASAADIARWMRMQLDEGSLDGQQILDAAIIAEMRTPHTPIRMSAAEKKLQPSMHFSAYGLGWFLCDINGRFCVRHTGGVDGMLSSVALVPEEKLGVAVFTNKLPNRAFVLLRDALVDLLTGAPQRDWLQAYQELAAEDTAAEQGAQQRKVESRAQDAPAALKLEAYAGQYESELLGGASVSLTDGRLRIQLEASETIGGSLEHWHYDTFLCRWDNPVFGESLMPFLTDGQGHVRELRFAIRPDWIDPLEHVFKKVG